MLEAAEGITGCAVVRIILEQPLEKQSSLYRNTAVWSTAEVAVGNPARTSAVVGPPVVVTRAGCLLLFARQS